MTRPAPWKWLIALVVATAPALGFLATTGAARQAPPVRPPVATPSARAAPGQRSATTSAVWLPKRGHFVRFTPRSKLTNPYPLRRLKPRGAFIVPATVLPVDSTGNMTVSCPMDGNDTLGDCGEAMVAHVSNILTYGQGKPGWTEDVFNVSALESQYESVSGGDNGLSEDEVINQIWKVGIGGNPAAVCTDALDFDVTNVPLTQYLIDQFYTVELAWSVPDDFLQNFETATIWADADTPDPDNGHFTPLASVHSGTLNGADITGFYELWTWGTYCYVSPAFVASVQPQAFVAFSPQQFSPTTGLDSKGRHITTQAAKWSAVGGNPIPQSVINAFPPAPSPVPVPTPTPVPVPTPTPVPVPTPTPVPVPTPPAPTPQPVPPPPMPATTLILYFDPQTHQLVLPAGYHAVVNHAGPQVVIHPVLQQVGVPGGWTIVVPAR